MNTLPKPFVFVLMPFSNAFEDVYESAIKPACAEAGAYCERVDEQHFDDTILSRIYNQISKANVIVAELSGRSPNVFYETGYAHALGKRVILLTSSADDIVFDMQHYSHVVYDGKLHVLKKRLQQKLAWALTHPDESLSAADPQLQYFVSGKALEDGVDLLLRGNTLQVDAFNGTTEVIEGQRVQIAVTVPVISKSKWSRFVVRLPSGDYMHHFPFVNQLWPQGWEASTISFSTEMPKEFTALQNGLAAEIQIVTPMRVYKYSVKLFANYKVE